MTKIRITLDIDRDHLDLVDKAAELEFISRNKFFIKSAIKEANEVIE